MSVAQANEVSNSTPAPERLKREFSIVNQRGLHARASAKFVQTVENHDADVEVEKDGITVGGTSIMGLMMLAASPGCKIRVSASGREAEALLDALQVLIADRFGEEC
ncbi:MAG: HPr family phosphocarrier protein [Nitratireductor sp.]|uniref:HPr family phosphocarrier protein n=1 Tax=Nitratireductor rhodophyticola TaxID=2854036 RepID=UPI0030097563